MLTAKAVRAALEMEVSTLLIAGGWQPTPDCANWPKSVAPKRD